MSLPENIYRILTPDGLLTGQGGGGLFGGSGRGLVTAGGKGGGPGGGGGALFRLCSADLTGGGV